MKSLTLSPGTRLYVVSGWAREVPDDEPRQAHVDGMLAKPIDVGALRRLLAGPANGVPAERGGKLGMLAPCSPSSSRER